MRLHILHQGTADIRTADIVILCGETMLDCKFACMCIMCFSAFLCILMVYMGSVVAELCKCTSPGFPITTALAIH